SRAARGGRGSAFRCGRPGRHATGEAGASACPAGGTGAPSGGDGTSRGTGLRGGGERTGGLRRDHPRGDRQVAGGDRACGHRAGL
ncbi:MAG: BUG/TctC family periplasmic protein, partial [uncultured Acetobacteraceae bacterium]